MKNVAFNMTRGNLFSCVNLVILAYCIFCRKRINKIYWLEFWKTIDIQQFQISVVKNIDFNIFDKCMYSWLLHDGLKIFINKDLLNLTNYTGLAFGLSFLDCRFWTCYIWHFKTVWNLEFVLGILYSFDVNCFWRSFFKYILF